MLALMLKWGSWRGFRLFNAFVTMARQNIATTFSNLRFPLMIGVVMIHCSISDTGNLVMDYVSKLFSEILPVFCVPIFFFISGYFFFANVSEFSIQVYREKVRRRIRTLFVPYVCANLFMIFCYGCAHYFIPQYINPENFNVLQYSVKDFVRAFWSIDGFPICYPLWYMEKPCARDPRSPVPLTLAVQNSLTL